MALNRRPQVQSDLADVIKTSFLLFSRSNQTQGLQTRGGQKGPPGRGLRSKRCAASRGTIDIKKKGQLSCTVIKENAKFANSAKNLFYKIDAEASYLPYSSVKICLPISCELGNQIHTLYSKHKLYKLWGRGRTPSVGVTSFQRQHLHVES